MVARTAVPLCLHQVGEHAATLSGALRAGGVWRVATPQLAGGGMVSAYLAPTHPQPCGGGQGGGSGGDRGDRGDRGGGDRGGGLPLTELQIGYDSTRRVHLAAGQALFN
eukprot:scaffold86096_cov57-Phaeocystis_antarctica.AAC.2